MDINERFDPSMHEPTWGEMRHCYRCGRRMGAYEYGPMHKECPVTDEAEEMNRRLRAIRGLWETAANAAEAQGRLDDAAFWRSRR